MKLDESVKRISKLNIRVHFDPSRLGSLFTKGKDENESVHAKHVDVNIVFAFVVIPSLTRE